jgi:hypothetical protein
VTAYESDPLTEPVQITTMRSIRRRHRHGLTGSEELGDPLLVDTFVDTTHGDVDPRRPTAPEPRLP